MQPKLKIVLSAAKRNSRDLPKMVAAGPLPPLRAPARGGPSRGRMRVASFHALLPPPFSPSSILFADAGDGGSRSISGLAKGAAAARKGACRGASRTGRGRSGGGGGFAPGAAAARYMSDLKLQIKTEREQCQLQAGQGCQFLLPLHHPPVLLHLPLLIRQTLSCPS